MKLFNIDEASLYESLDTQNKLNLVFDQPKTNDFWRNLNKCLKDNQDKISVRITGFSGTWKDLSFLELIENVTSISIDAFGIYDYSHIEYLTNLKALRLGVLDSPVIDISFLPKLKKLTDLRVCSEVKNLTEIGKLSWLNNLSIMYNDFQNLDFLNEITGLKKLSLGNGEIESLDSFANFKSLECLDLFYLNGLTNIDIVSEMSSLKVLKLSNLRKVKTLPVFTKNKRLRQLTLKNAHHFSNLNPIETAENLEQLYIYDSNCSGMELIDAINKLRYLKHVYAEVKAKRDIYEYLKSRGIENHPC